MQYVFFAYDFGGGPGFYHPNLDVAIRYCEDCIEDNREHACEHGIWPATAEAIGVYRVPAGVPEVDLYLDAEPYLQAVLVADEELLDEDGEVLFDCELRRVFS